MDTHQNPFIQRLSKIERKIDRLLNIVGSDMRMTDHLITVKEAARMLAISEYCLRQEIKRGNIKAKKRGRAYHLSYIDVMKRIS